MNEQNIEQFELYISNKMSTTDQKSFENSLQNDENLRSQFKTYQEINSFLQTKFSAESALFTENLKGISKQHFNLKTGKKVRIINLNSKYFAIAASVVLFFSLFFVLQNNPPKYTDYNQHEKATFVERGDENKALLLAQKAFNDKQYQKAIPLFETVLKLNYKPEVLYLYAICLIETDNFTKAEDILLSLKNGTSIYNYRATWYLALLRLKQNNINSCKNFLKQIPADAEDFAKAQELLKLL